ncbi:MAG: hypothetical protein RLZ98_333 [Pseudomonadota bacterium]|jgi:phthalate 4,5-dioxygenase oxygenase subunit
MLAKEKNELLCRVEGDAPMGRLMRRYWVPALQARDLVAGGAPKRVRLFGEDLVAFRSPDGSIGLIEEYCPHRRASMAIAKNEDCGLRCLYHGWLIDAEGTIVETPAEPADSRLKERVKAVAYPVREAGGIVWTYMGPKEAEPPPMDFEFTGMPSSRVLIMQAREECNWAQTMEGVIDSAHSNYLHATEIRPKEGVSKTVQGGEKDGHFARPSNDGAPRLEVQMQPYGFRYAAIRKPIIDPETKKYVRVTLFVAPCYAIFPAPKGWASMQMFVPIDDTHTMFYYVMWNYEQDLSDELRAHYFEKHGVRVGIDMDDQYRKVRNRDNTWLQDRDAMREGRSASGIFGINTEDFAVQESMGPIIDRSTENLGQSDLAVVHFRRLMLDAVERFESTGELPPGLRDPVDFSALKSAEAIVPHDVDWRVVADGQFEQAAE